MSGTKGGNLVENVPDTMLDIVTMKIAYTDSCILKHTYTCMHAHTAGGVKENFTILEERKMQFTVLCTNLLPNKTKLLSYDQWLHDYQVYSVITYSRELK